VTMTDFSNIASFYDLMTGYSRRLVNDVGVIKGVVEKFGISSALDAGCGTGIHTIILTRLGVDVVGYDSSPEMLAKAETNAAAEGVSPVLVQGYFESMPGEWTGKFDAVFCLANSLAGVGTPEGLAKSLGSFCRVLKPGGRAIIQLLNTPHFKAADRRIIKVSVAGVYTFVRFFDFAGDVTRLNVIVIERDGERVDHRLISEPILAVDKEVLTVSAQKCGFSAVNLYSDLSLSKPLAADSDNIVAILRR